MSFVTRLTLSSGDREALDAVVGEIKRTVERKGAELRGPHPNSPAEYRVPQSKRLDAEGERFDPWKYTVYVRRMEIGGHHEAVRAVTERGFPPAIHVEAEIERVRSLGGRG